MVVSQSGLGQEIVAVSGRGFGQLHRSGLVAAVRDQLVEDLVRVVGRVEGMLDFSGFMAGRGLAVDVVGLCPDDGTGAEFLETDGIVVFGWRQGAEKGFLRRRK